MIPVKDVMTTEVVTFREDTPIEEVISTLTARKITGAPVVEKDGHVVGIVSEIDVVSKQGKTASDIMSPHVISITEDTGVDAAARLLSGERIRRVPVLRQGRMVGLLSRSDILDFFAHSQWTCATCGQAQRGLEQPERCDSCQGTDFHFERAAPGT